MSAEYGWLDNIGSTIYSKVKYKASQTLKAKNSTKYADDNFRWTITDKPKDSNVTKKYTVYLHQIASNETNVDLEGVNVNGVNYAMQIDVIAETSQDDVEEIMSVIRNIFKSMRFTVTQFPLFENETSGYRAIMRVKRSIGNMDYI